MSITIEFLICGIKHAPTNNRMLHGSIKWLFFEKIKSRPRITHRENDYLLAFTKIGDLKKKPHNFLAEKTAVERDGIPRPVD